MEMDEIVLGAVGIQHASTFAKGNFTTKTPNEGIRTKKRVNLQHLMLFACLSAVARSSDSPDGFIVSVNIHDFIPGVAASSYRVRNLSRH